jgi:hypothetical protein
LSDVDVPWWRLSRGPEGSAGADRAELALIADQDDLGLGEIAGAQQAEHVAVIGHPGLVEHDDVAPDELERAVVQTPEEGGDGAALGEVGFRPRVRAAWPEVAVPTTS